ncbi:hypothetical protein [Lysinibacillus capsici]|uniref:hypothetical protein n=1 Tax=Lysinibacillus capsici TaxID=2115968 RepID=UPI002480FE5D|nr:hypothetical protein [Lysinibacillus capsici]
MCESNKNQPIVGGLVSRAEGVKFENCHAEVKIISNGELGKFGGLAAIAVDSEFKDSTSSVEITINSESVFNELKREVLKVNEVEIQKELLNLIEKMESSQGTKTFKEHFNNFISRSADYMTLVTPFLPKLIEIIQ